MNLDDQNSISKPDNFKQKISKALASFSLTEKVLSGLLVLILIATTFSALIKVNSRFLVEVPQRGGEITEGLIGAPRFINPAIAISDTDRDISSLVYSGLLKVSANGEVVNDLASEHSVSEDGLIYKVKIRDDAFFHDGEAVTTEDVIFTIKQTQDPKIKSPKRPNWDGIEIQKINEKEIQFILSQPYSPFIYNLTLGVLPEHIWSKISSDEFAFSKYNLEPVGSGPFEISKVETNQDGIVEKYILKSYKRYTLGEPYISKMIFAIYKNEEELVQALNKNQIDSAHSISPQNANLVTSSEKELISLPFSRIFAIYFNQSDSQLLSDDNIRKVLDLVIPRQEVIDQVLSGFAKPIKTPVPANILEKEFNFETNLDEAKKILENNGWQIGEDGIYQTGEEDSVTKLSFSMSTANVQELIAVSEFIAEKYREFGIEVNLKIFEPNDLTLNVIRPREFESIFFGQVVNRDLDLYGFWHSSQRNDPGLNIAGFTNIDADAELENVRETFDIEEKKESLQNFVEEVNIDIPAIFLYSPDFIYFIPKNLSLEIPDTIVTSSDRFLDVEKWYIKTDFVWEIFSK